jgi:transcriptional repressor NrdR
MDKEVSSLKIGEMVLKKLRDLDEVAYVRFASVYRQFRDVSEFNHEVKVLLQSENT